MIRGIRMSRVAFGCAAIGGYDYGAVSDEQSSRALWAALEQGITTFDVADVYGFGHAERLLGEVFRGRRKDIIIATKVGVRWDADGRTWRDLRPDYLREAVRQSLARLQTDYVDLLQLHWPSPEHPPEAAVEALDQLRTEGLVRAVGCCNFSSALLDRAALGGAVDSIQLPLSLVQRDSEPVLSYARERFRMGVLVYNALAQGLLTGKYDRTSTFTGTDLRQRSVLFADRERERGLRVVAALRAVGARRGRTPAQVAIRWLLDHPDVDIVLAGAKSEAQVEENAGATGWTLDFHERTELATAAAALADVPLTENP